MALHGKNEIKNRRCPPPPLVAAVPPVLRDSYRARPLIRRFSKGQRSPSVVWVSRARLRGFRGVWEGPGRLRGSRGVWEGPRGVWEGPRGRPEGHSRVSGHPAVLRSDQDVGFLWPAGCGRWRDSHIPRPLSADRRRVTNHCYVSSVPVDQLTKQRFWA